MSTWDGLGNYRDPDIDRLVKAAVPVVSGAQSQVSALTDAYLSRVTASTLGAPMRVAGVRGAVRNPRGVDPQEVYRRPGISVWTALSHGASFTDAVKAGRERLWDIAVTDLQLSKTHTSRAVFERDSRVVGYSRVLGGGDNCGLCVLAATQRYHVEDLMPIHPGCGCDVEPLHGDRDPGQVIDRDTLDETNAALTERFGTDKPDLRDVMVRQHGEIGPVLAVRGQAFTGPDDL